MNLRFNSCEYTKDNPYLSRDCLSFAIQKSCFCTGYSTNFNILQFHHLIGIHICIIFSHRLSPFNSLRSHHPLKHFEVRIIPRRAIDRKFNGFKCVQIIRNHFFGSTRHHFRLILERSASECAQNHHFVTVQYGNIQNPGQPLLMNFQEFPVTDFYRPVTVTLVEPVARSLPQVRRRTGDHIHIIPLCLIHQLRPARIRLEYGHIRRVNDIRIVDRILCIPMRVIESFHHFRYAQAEIQAGTPTQTFLLCAGSPLVTPPPGLVAEAKLCTATFWPA